MKQKLLSLLLLAAGGLAALIILGCETSFYPAGRIELKNPAGNETRAFTEMDGFSDISIHLYASDWPHTFMRPVRLGETYSHHNARWSRDGTVLGTTTTSGPGEPEYFHSAYDFKKHEGIPDEPPLSPHYTDDHHKITTLMESRGGIGEPPNDLDSGKGDSHLPTPLWVWIAPVLVFGICFQFADKMWPKKKKIAAHRITPEAALP